MNSFFKLIFKNVSLGRALRSELEEDLGFLVRPWPGLLGFGLRYFVYKFLFKKIKSQPYIFPGVRFVYTDRISLGEGVLINSFTYIYGKGGIEIGDHVLVSPHCSIVAGDHNFEPDKLILEQSPKLQGIVIEDDCWIGANSVVVGGVTIAKGSVIGAGAVVTADTKPYSINAGIPAKMVGRRDSDQPVPVRK